jgi:hypothetical protein
MSRKSKVGTESGGTWHHPLAIEVWLNNGKSSRSCNRDNLVEALRSGLDCGSPKFDINTEIRKYGNTEIRIHFPYFTRYLRREGRFLRVKIL